MASLPKLFEAFLHAIKRHKGALFSQGSNTGTAALTEQVQAAGMGFYALCDHLLSESTSSKEAVWRTRVDLLGIVDIERLYNPRNEDNTVLLRSSCALAVEVLAAPPTGTY